MKISEIIKKSVLETNKQLKKKDRITYGKKFQILGKGSSLDSFVIVNLFIAIDEKVKTATLDKLRKLENFSKWKF